MIELLMGDEGVALAAIHSGISGVFSYPGTPATEILEYVRERTQGNGAVVSRWSANEKVAYEEALGMSFAGRRALVAMKHVGLNVAADPFMSSALTGAHGGVVLAVADDPGMHSSQNEQDSRYYAQFAKLPLLEPATQQEAYDMTREAFELSERVGLPVLVRLVTRLAHSRGNVETRTARTQTSIGRVTETADWTLLPVNARRRFRRLLELQDHLLDYTKNSPFNFLVRRGRRGILTAGIGYNYVSEALGTDSNYSLLKIGTYPVPVELIRRLVDHCDEILIVEEGYPFMESQLNGLLGVPGKSVLGKLSGTLPPDGELTPDRVREALGMTTHRGRATVEDVPPRPPQLCQGCPHCDTYRAIMDATGRAQRPYLFSDIGCYTLSALPPYNAIDTCVDMGASISMALGAAKAGAHPVICSIGDSTFIHSGMTGLIGAAHENANMTVFILDNAVVGMTGGQEVFATGDRLVEIVKGLGVDERHLVVFEPLKKTHEQTVECIRREIDYPGLSVIIARRPCIHFKRREAASERGNTVAVSRAPQPT
jgi:indolepyruvate ferredoxin oxidoreductase alpha subunit